MGKAFLAICALRLVDTGLVTLDDPIARVWPEFAAAGKNGATLRHALCHRAGVPAIRSPLANEDLWRWDRMCAALAATEPWWEPGTRHAYHTNTYGHLIGEVIRRASGETVTQTSGCMDPASRCRRPCRRTGGGGGAMCHGALRGRRSGRTRSTSTLLEGDQLMEMLSYFNPPGYSSMGVVNTPQWRAAEVPSTNGHGTARGVARVYAALLQPGLLLSTDLMAEAVSPQSEGFCPILHEEVTFGLGFKPTAPRRPFGPNPHSFGHFGTGGAVGFADPDAGVAFGYVMNARHPTLAEHAQSRVDRCGVRTSLTPSTGVWPGE